ncbi:MAG: exodeoxyribonuclease VII large subunit [Eubacterium sp.]|nr:exodeoxyribonuclease VII large subunit [Eubacterium sp.]
MASKRVFEVSQINSYIHRLFESDYALKRIYIKGEVSNCKYHSSGHLYFTLKDSRSAIRCVMFAGDLARGLSFRLEDGQMIIVLGSVSVYEQAGTYQLYAREITLAGAGDLYILYEQRKQELYKKGYFDFERKKPLPAFPRTIGIVTASTGAAIRDIESIAARRNPYVQLILYPSRVQGEGAAAQIARGIRTLDAMDLDVIIIGRGGGSIEDLWAFNELEVADAVYEASTPIISGTGHETDNTIADYCADVRAATPSAACELAVPDIRAVRNQFDNYRMTLDQLMTGRLDNLKESLKMRAIRLESAAPASRLKRQRILLREKAFRLQAAASGNLQRVRHRFSVTAEKLHVLSPTARLTGGYVYAQYDRKTPVTSVTQLEPGRDLTLVFSDGSADVTPTRIHKDK